MNFENSYPNVFTSPPRQHPYSSSISSSASSSTSSVFSVDATSSQGSEATSYTSSSSIHVTWDTEDPWRSSYRDKAPPTVKRVFPSVQIKTSEVAVAPELRQHPRRCSSGNTKAPPALLRQSERKCQFVDCLVDSATTMVEVIWPISAPHERGYQGGLPLRTFIQETLRRSRTSFSTLQVALYYLILIKAHVPRYDFTMEQPVDSAWIRALQCGRRMFLAALILASKYLQDRNYSARAWSKISGLKVCEINLNEMAFLKAVEWKLHFPEPLFDRWQKILMNYTPQQPPSPGSPLRGPSDAWRSAILRLTPALDTIDALDRPFQLSMTSLRKRMTPPPLITSLANAQSSGMPSPVTPIPPRVLEPTPNMPPPTPSLVRLGPLPTPSMTPHSAVSNTPAASLTGLESRRPSYGCSAMARTQREIQMSEYAHAAFDGWTSRRPSVISSTSSSSSSPESMVSDNSSRCSRASSISSASSVSSTSACAPAAKLARLATLRCAGLPYSLPPPQQQPRYKENCPPALPLGSITMEPLYTEPMSSPDFDSFHISSEDALETPTRLPARSSPGKRKRGRSSVDLSQMQQNVRDLLNAASLVDNYATSCQVLPDRNAASSFLLQENRKPISCLDPKALQSPARSVPERRLPVQKDFGRKRVCAVEAVPARSAFHWQELVLDA